MPATPTWAVLPFAAYLLLIAALPLFLGRLWESNRNKLLLAIVASLPVGLYLLRSHPAGLDVLLETGREYLSFMALLGALFVISGGIHLSGKLAGTPAVNTAFLAIGSILASVIGTTGASALLIRPLLRANEKRKHTRHIVIFFIFIVANGAGMLTPLGDPPLFLGFLRGVPFGWTLRLAGPWVVVNGVLLLVFTLLDEAITQHDTPPSGSRERLRIDGALNFVWLLGVVATVFLVGTFGHHDAQAASIQISWTIALGALSVLTTPRRIHEANRFTWAPIVEVGVVFVGVFVTMIPALSFLQERGASLGITRPVHFFWASGALSSVLDNAPTYLTFASLASGVAHAADLATLAVHPVGEKLLAAVSCGSVCMGAITYIGNGPNFMVKAIAEQHHVRMPSFFGYTLWSLAILVPLFGVVAYLFF